MPKELGSGAISVARLKLCRRSNPTQSGSICGWPRVDGCRLMGKILSVDVPGLTFLGYSVSNDSPRCKRACVLHACCAVLTSTVLMAHAGRYQVGAIRPPQKTHKEASSRKAHKGAHQRPRRACSGAPRICAGDGLGCCGTPGSWLKSAAARSRKPHLCGAAPRGSTQPRGAGKFFLAVPGAGRLGPGNVGNALVGLACQVLEGACRCLEGYPMALASFRASCAPSAGSSVLAGQPIPSPALGLGLGMIWKWTCAMA